MRKLLVVIGIVLFFVCSGYGQPVFLDQWFNNNYVINPAITGIEKYVDINLGTRYQWADVEGAPSTYFVTAHSSIGEARSKRGFSKSRMPQPKYPHHYNPTHQRPHHGIGGTIYSDNIGPFSNMNVSASYAFHLPLSKSVTLSSGIRTGFTHQTLDLNKVSSNLLSDPAVIDYENGFRWNITPGFWLYGDNFYVGLSMIGLQQRTWLNGALITTAGYRFDNDQEGIHFMPFMVLRMNLIYQSNFDLGLKMDWNQLIYWGATYRSTNEMVFFLSGVVNDNLSLTYLFDVGGERSYTYNSGISHELQLNIRLKNTDRVPTMLKPKMR